MKETAIAPSNIAFIKYWGVGDAQLRLPTNNSISMNLSNLQTTTTVQFDKDFSEDIITIDGKQNSAETQRVSKHLDKIRKLAKIGTFAKVVSKNSFPASTGLSSSASGFAALTAASAKACGLQLNEKELSILSRLGSGSACRSIPDGIAEWIAGDSSETSYAHSLYKPEYWNIVDIVAVISSGKKEIGTSKGQALAQTSPFFPIRLTHINEKIRLLKKYLQEKDFPALGKLIEAEALELHAIMLTSSPPLLYWQPATIMLMRHIQKWRREGLSVYFSLNTGQDVHIICQKSDSTKIQKLLTAIPEVKQVIPNHSAKGACLTNIHLF